MTKIRALILDVDGTLTDGRLIVDPAQAEEGRDYHVHDGFGLRLFQDLGGVVILCTGKGGPSVRRRAEVLGIEHVIERSRDKRAEASALLDRLGITLDETAMVGDDWPDVTLMRACGTSFAVANARPEVCAAAAEILSRDGGHGAVREAVELILRRNGDWETACTRYDVDPTAATSATTRPEGA